MYKQQAFDSSQSLALSSQVYHARSLVAQTTLKSKRNCNSSSNKSSNSHSSSNYGGAGGEEWLSMIGLICYSLA
jgi:hypothetical protein